MGRPIAVFKEIPNQRGGPVMIRSQDVGSAKVRHISGIFAQNTSNGNRAREKKDREMKGAMRMGGGPGREEIKPRPFPELAVINKGQEICKFNPLKIPENTKFPQISTRKIISTSH